jgi:hyperosmotically inducible periplasmic protein
MTKKLFLTLALIAGLFGMTNSILAQSNQNSAARLDRQIRKEILTLPYYGVFDAIGYQINGSTVTLTGYVVRPITKSDAKGAVEDINGVERVINNIEVLPLSPNDDRIRQATLRSLANRGSLYRYFLGANPAIRIIVRNGRIQLEGFVDNKGDYNLANITARTVPGSFGVTNNLKVVRDE